MKAIQVKYLPPTSSRGSKWKASAEGVKPLTLSYDYDLDGARNAQKAAAALCARQDWFGPIVGGQLADGSWVFCFTVAGPYTVTAADLIGPPAKAAKG